MRIEYNTLTAIIICIGVIAAAIMIIIDAERADEPIANNGDDFAGWELNDHDFNGN